MRLTLLPLIFLALVSCARPSAPPRPTAEQGLAQCKVDIGGLAATNFVAAADVNARLRDCMLGQGFLTTPACTQPTQWAEASCYGGNPS